MAEQTYETFLQKIEEEAAAAKQVLLTGLKYLEMGILEIPHLIPIFDAVSPLFIKSQAAKDAVAKGEDAALAVANVLAVAKGNTGIVHADAGGTQTQQ